MTPEQAKAVAEGTAFTLVLVPLIVGLVLYRIHRG